MLTMLNFDELAGIEQIIQQWKSALDSLDDIPYDGDSSRMVVLDVLLQDGRRYRHRYLAEELCNTYDIMRYSAFTRTSTTVPSRPGAPKSVFVMRKEDEICFTFFPMSLKTLDVLHAYASYFSQTLKQYKARGNLDYLRATLVQFVRRLFDMVFKDAHGYNLHEFTQELPLLILCAHLWGNAVLSTLLVHISTTFCLLKSGVSPLRLSASFKCSPPSIADIETILTRSPPSTNDKQV